VEKTKKKPKKFFSFYFKNINWLTGTSAALGGFFLGLALMTRTSEALWLLPMFFILWLFNFKRVGISKFLIFLAFVFIAWLPAGCWNQVLFGSPVYSGYPEMNTSLAEITQSGPKLADSIIPTDREQIKNILIKIKNNIFYFGFDPIQSWEMFRYYFIKMFPWLFFLGISGLFLFFQRIYHWCKKNWLYLSSLSLTAIILILYYGSWEFFDNPNTASHTIGNSYTRYWLPIYAGFIPFVSLFLVKFSRGLFPFYKWQPEFKDKLNWLKAKKSKKLFSLRAKFLVNGLRILVVYLIILLSLNFVLFGSEEGLFYSLDKSREARESYEKVINLTETNAVIITNYQDKIFFPERKVVVGDFSNKQIIKKYAILAEYLPVYYYNFFLNKKDLDYLNNRRLGEAGLSIDKISKISYNFSLYKINKK